MPALTDFAKTSDYLVEGLPLFLLIVTLIHYFRTKTRVYLYFASSFFFELAVKLLSVTFVSLLKTHSSELNGGISPSNKTAEEVFKKILVEDPKIVTLAFIGMPLAFLQDLSICLGILCLLGAWISSARSVLGPKTTCGLTVVKVLRVFFASLAVVCVIALFTSMAATTVIESLISMNENTKVSPYAAAAYLAAAVFFDSGRVFVCSCQIVPVWSRRIEYGKV